MALNTINWKPDSKQLSQFSEFGMFILGLLAAPLMIYQGHMQVATGLWLAAIALRLVGLAKPEWLHWPFVVLTVVTWPIGWVISHAALALIYYGVFTPMALVFRLIGRDALERKLDPQAASYWEAYNPDRGAARYLRQF